MKRFGYNKFQTQQESEQKKIYWEGVIIGIIVCGIGVIILSVLKSLFL